MGILDSDYFYDIYCSKRADECKSLREAFDCYCPECDNGGDIIKYYVERHEKDEKFEVDVEWLGYARIAQLLTTLMGTSYDIFKPWCKRQYMSLLDENDEDLTTHEIYWKRRVADQFSYYKNAWDKVDETLD